jgi:flagellin-like protein
MKKIWRIRKDSEAVSPVIATILMVAITVVLAAVLYVMVMGFGGPTSNPPIAAFDSPTKTSGHTYKIAIVSIDKTTQWSDCKLSIVNVTSEVSGALVPGALTMTPARVPIETVALVDLAGSTDKTIGAGDYFTIGASLTAGVTYTVTLLWGVDNDRIATATFTTI